jgi:hypothetical protein
VERYGDIYSKQHKRGKQYDAHLLKHSNEKVKFCLLLYTGEILKSFTLREEYKSRVFDNIVLRRK